MKIGILTFHTSENYGAVLQAYALQETLKREFNSSEVEIINYAPITTKKSYRIYKYKSNNIIKQFLLYCLTTYYYFALKNKKNKFYSFVNNFLNLSNQTYLTELEFLGNIPNYDVYITGSDQVFNPNNPNNKRIFFLDFPKNKSKKIAYAPSFGVTQFSDEQKEKITSFISSFDALSCRENEGANFLTKITGKKVPVVLDPVFLLSEKEWNKVIVLPKTKDKYIFIYDLNGGEALVKIANKIKGKTGYKIVCCTSKITAFYHIDKQLYNLGPQEFLGYIKNAEYVVTDSFHGTAFSVVFNKKFYSYIAFSKTSSRIISLLKNLGIDNRLVLKESLSSFHVENKLFNSNKYLNKLDDLKKKSILYLSDNI